MKVLALISGGKDSTFNMMCCHSEGHQIVALANLYPSTNKDELDSFMFQTVGHMGIEKYAEAMEIPLFRMETIGKSKQTTKMYEPKSEDDEVEDLYRLIENVKKEVNFEAVAVGAILSDYQRIRVENVCSRLKLTCLAYLWQRDQVELLQEMIDSNLDAILIKVACLGLTCKTHLGKSIKDVQSHLLSLKSKFGVNVCGEGGEYETFTLDCPLFKKKIVIDESEIVETSSDPVCPVGHLNFKKSHLEDKTNDSTEIKVKTSKDFIEDCLEFYDKKTYEFNRIINQTSPTTRNFKIQCLNDGNGFYWISGIEGIGATMKEGTIHALNQLEEILTKNSLNINESIYVSLYISNMSAYLELNQLYNEKFNFQNPPPRVCVETSLPKSCQVMIEVLLFKQNSENLKSINSLHVQGMSNWAPANIGPYSQSKSIDSIVLISGQIGLIPGNLTVIEGGIKNQNKLTLRHIERVSKVMNCSNRLKNCIHGICFITHPEHIEIAKLEWAKSTIKSISNFVVVSSLPRAALVEWQVICFNQEDEEFEYDEWNYSNIEGLEISLKRRWNSSYFTASCKVSETDKKYGKNEIRKVFEILFEKLNLTRILQMKVFYKIIKDSSTNIYEEIFDEIYCEKNLKVATSFIPSQYVEDENSILSISFVGF